MNQLYFGDNLEILRSMRDESVDLIYLDPPFNSKRQYNMNVKGSEEQERAFDDVWTWNQAEDALLAGLKAKYSDPVSLAMYDCLEMLIKLLGGKRDSLAAYLVNMGVRLIEMRRVLARTGSIYLHCDPSASHYLKIMMDLVFGEKNFRNEIIWKRYGSHNDSKRFGNVHDVILTYAKSAQHVKANKLFEPYREEYLKQSYSKVTEDGRRFRTKPLTAESLAGGGYTYEWNGHTRVWKCPISKMTELHNAGELYYSKNGPAQGKVYLDEMPGVPLGDVWTDIPSLSNSSAERQGYPTQKPIALLERIIAASSNPGDTILDPFCGCGTTIAAAEKIGDRKWIGIDIALLAVDVIEKRLVNQGVTGFKIEGLPSTVASAKRLADKDKFTFERWAVKAMGAYTPGRQTGDKGIDGKAHFTKDNGDRGNVVVSVKGGATVSPTFARDLRGTLEREGADMGVLIVFDKPTPGVRDEMNHSGSFKVGNTTYPRLQVITVAELVSGKAFNLPDFQH